MIQRLRRNCLLTVLVGLFPCLLNAQDHLTDSLEKEFVRATQPGKKTKILIALYDAVLYTDPGKALRIALEINTIRSLSGQNTGREKLESLNLIGIAYMTLDQADSALFYLQKVGEYAIATGDSVSLSRSYNNIGVLNANQANYQGAVYYFDKSAEIDEAIGDMEGSLISLLNIGSLLTQLDELDSARTYLTNALWLAKKINDKALIATGHSSLGILEYGAKNYQQAEQHYLEAIELGEELNDMDIIAGGYRNLSKLFMDKGLYHKAIDYDTKSLEYALKSGDLDAVQRAYHGLAVAYENLGLYREAYENHKQYTAFLDTLTQRQNTATLIEMQEKYKSDQTIKENEILTQKNEIKDLEIVNKDLEIAKNEKDLANSNIIIVSSILGLVLLIILAFTLYNRNVLKQKANQKLQHANEIIQEKNKDILDSIKYARRIQEAILPPENLAKKIMPENFILYKPKDIVSGDFYFVDKRNEHLIVAAVDCTGHGVPGALMSVVGHNGLTRALKESNLTKPSDILDSLNRSVNETLRQTYEESAVKDGMDIALCSFNFAKSTVQFAGAHNPLWRIRHSASSGTGELVEIKADKQPIGAFMGEFQKPFANNELEMQPGDVFYVFTDGYADQFGGEKGKKFKSSQLKELLLSIYTKSMAQQKEIVLDVFNKWKGELEQVDDVCIIGIRV